ncbi:flagellar hook capping FlgD N-terminal domain-containing protein [Paenibacillus sp. YPG26]|uniref:flagellar hook capping FlgD N-terminal domain-containing protein n=1 Tax=Paenibacillus sp. YPG26 TaxID=2878915 RepID=UPI0020413CB1|nr:flagellar hook capping FlgD N-terminal domain-containing protein [Paenibacillus sp. YPG26]USB32093.1 flagellar hook capping protein [Paenibacillus sp. YPG26]
MADITSTNVTRSNYSTENATKSAASSTQTMGKDQFLRILVTQLGNQDPMQPLQDKEFIAQMAQFTSVEQLMNISSQLTAMNQNLGTLSGLIGKQVSWINTTETSGFDFATGKPITASTTANGIVDSIVIRGGVQYAKVGEREVAIDKITKINNAEETKAAEDASGAGAK